MRHIYRCVSQGQRRKNLAQVFVIELIPVQLYILCLSYLYFLARQFEFLIKKFQGQLKTIKIIMI